MIISVRTRVVCFNFGAFVESAKKLSFWADGWLADLFFILPPMLSLVYQS